MIHYEKLPEHCRDGMRLYIERGVIPGKFLTPVLCNNLVDAYGQADDINTARMRDYAEFLYNDAPSECWGSKEKVIAWSKAGGLSQYAEVINEP